MKCVLLLTLLSLAFCQDYTYITASTPTPYNLFGLDTPVTVPSPHRRIHLSQGVVFTGGLCGGNNNFSWICQTTPIAASYGAYRYDNSNCASGIDCSTPFYSPNPKVISNILNNPAFKSPPFLHPRKVNQLQLGMATLINHDIARHIFNTTYPGTQRMVIPMPVDPYDPLTQIFDPVHEGSNLTAVGDTVQTYEWSASPSPTSLALTINRVGGVPGTGPGTGNPKNSQAGGSLWLDLDSFYGNPTQVAPGNVGLGNATFISKMNTTNGFLVVDANGLPWNTGTLIDPATYPIAYVLVAEHNMYAAGVAANLASRSISLSGTQIFFLARRWVIATWQALVMYEYAPILFAGPMPPYNPRQMDANWSSYIEVSAIAHYGYSAFGQDFQMLDSNWDIVDDISARGCYQGVSDSANPASVVNKEPRNALYAWNYWGPEIFTRGMIQKPQEVIDAYFCDALKTASPTATDIIARQITRQRDIGVPTYNDIRQAWGFPKYTSFSNFTGLTPQAQTLLASVYNNSVDLVDFYVGGFANYNPNYHMDPVWTAIYQQYWSELRDFDPWWFEGTQTGFTAAEITQLQNTKLSTLLLKHTNIGSVPCSAMYANPPDCPSAPKTSCASLNPNNFMLTPSLSISWVNSTAGSNLVQFTVSAPTAGFVALGFPSTPGQMVGTTAFLSTVVGNIVNTSVYHISARQPCTKGVGVCPFPNSNYTVTVVSGAQLNGTTTVTFTVYPVPPGVMNIVGSFGPNVVPSYHGANKGVGQITILTNPAPVAPVTCAAPSSTTACPSQAPCTCPTAAPTVKCGAGNVLPVSFSLISLFLILSQFLF